MTVSDRWPFEAVGKATDTLRAASSQDAAAAVREAAS